MRKLPDKVKDTRVTSNHLLAISHATARNVADSEVESISSSAINSVTFSEKTGKVIGSRSSCSSTVAQCYYRWSPTAKRDDARTE